MKIICSILFLFCLHLESDAQYIGLASGYNYQKYSAAEFQLHYPLAYGAHPATLNPVTGLEILKHNNNIYLSPNFGIRYYKGLPTTSGINFKLSYSWLKMDGIRDRRLTPEIGFTFKQKINVSYGFNLKTSKEINPAKGQHKISVYFTWYH